MPTGVHSGHRFIDLAGLRFGKLEVISKAPNRGRKLAWNCVCDCGREKIICTVNLRSGKSNGCGICWRSAAKNRLTHGEAANSKSQTTEYRTWAAMKRRCYNEKCKDFPLYGGRGVTVCDEWRNSYSAFLEHVGRRPDKNLSLDRIDVNKGYEPGNVRWATAREQRMNQRRMLR